MASCSKCRGEVSSYSVTDRRRLFKCNMSIGPDRRYMLRMRVRSRAYRGRFYYSESFDPR
jgi:hypothetical protein